MNEELHIGPPEDPAPQRTSFRYALLGGALVAFVVVAALLLPSGILLNPWFRGDREKRHVSASGGQLFFGAAEQSYAPKIQVENLAMSRAENFLNQEVTTLGGEVVNSGDRSLEGLELTVVFTDSLNQVVLREARTVLDATAPPLTAGARREFEISFEHVPSSWNMQLPVLSVTAMRIASSK
ncbi:MAG TPA: hypothetical protein VKF79_11640 [Candidatus Acidoferrum sp.]|nr:hypothetical protein [Candidatus Acidoferrum sp.]